MWDIYHFYVFLLHKLIQYANYPYSSDDRFKFYYLSNTKILWSFFRIPIEEDVWNLN